MSYKGLFKCKYRSKYVGSDPIIFRSSWEYCVMCWLDQNTNILQWGSESIVIPYILPDKKGGSMHRYFVDFNFTYKDGSKYLIEVKPKNQTIAPKYRRSEKYLEECKTFIKNQYKWLAAEKYAHNHKMTFEIWTEDVLEKKGIKLLK